MFRKMIEQVFPSLRERRANSNLFYFESTREQKVDVTTQSTDVPKPKLDTDISLEQKHLLAFYDGLFGQSNNLQQDELSAHVAGQIELLLEKPKLVLQNLPILPASLSQVIAALDDEDFDTAELVQLIEQEPFIAAKVIELANSTYYRRGEKSVTDIHTAFMTLGSRGLLEGVINGFVSSMTPRSKLYFRQYGDKIWQHSFTSGIFAKLMLENSGHKELASQGYLLGLLCNLGDVIIYQLMTDAFAVVHPDCQPDSKAFKALMIRHSKSLTYQMARYWQFPAPIVEALLAQVKLTRKSTLKNSFGKYPLACYVYEANILSELEMRSSSDIPLDAESLLEAGQQLLCSEQAMDFLDVIAAKAQLK